MSDALAFTFSIIYIMTSTLAVYSCVSLMRFYYKIKNAEVKIFRNSLIAQTWGFLLFLLSNAAFLIFSNYTSDYDTLLISIAIIGEILFIISNENIKSYLVSHD